MASLKFWIFSSNKQVPQETQHRTRKAAILTTIPPMLKVEHGMRTTLPNQTARLETCTGPTVHTGATTKQ